MSPLAVVLAWLAGVIVCELVARRRGARLGPGWRFVVVMLGPLAIPLVFFARRENKGQT